MPHHCQGERKQKHAAVQKRKKEFTLNLKMKSGSFWHNWLLQRKVEFTPGGVTLVIISY